MAAAKYRGHNMSMKADDMKDLIISKMNKESGSAAAANKKFGEAVLEYIIDNMDITYSWSATNPSGAADPAVSFTASLSGDGASTSNEETSTSDKEASTSNEETSTSDKEASTSNEETSTSDKEASTSDEETSTPDGKSLTPSESFADFLINLASFIKRNIKISPAAGYTLSPLVFNPAGIITASMNKEDDFDTAMTNFCKQIVTSLISSFPNPVPSSGSHGAFAGATKGMIIA